MRIIFFFLFIATSFKAVAQQYSLYWKFIEAKIRAIQPGGTIYYAQTPVRDILEKHYKEIDKSTVAGITVSGKEHINLTKQERQLILKRLKSCLNTVLPDSLFENSERKLTDSLAGFMYRWNNRVVDSLLDNGIPINGRFEFLHFGYYFSPPIYFRKGELMLYHFMYFAYSGGADEMYICRKRNGQWEKWILVGGSAW